jgi:putative heme iron utilization protein
LTAPGEDRGIAKLLLRATRTAALATIDRVAGGPLTTLVSLGTDYSGAPLMLFSQLSQHTMNLARDPRASLLLSTRAERGDPLNRPRLTLSGRIAPHGDARARARFVRQNPKSRLYSAFADFGVYRMEIAAVHFNGGFARAAAFEPRDLLIDVADAQGLIDAEEALLAHVNAEEGGAQARFERHPKQDAARRWRARSLDPEGLDLASGAATGRVVFDAPAYTSAAWLRALERSTGMQRP